MNQKLINLMLCNKIAEKLKEANLFEKVEKFTLTKHSDIQYGETSYYYVLKINDTYTLKPFWEGTEPFDRLLEFDENKEITAEYYIIYKIIWELKIKQWSFTYERYGVISFAEARRILEEQRLEYERQLDEQRQHKAEESSRLDPIVADRILTKPKYVVTTLLSYGYTLEEIKEFGLHLIEEVNRRALSNDNSGNI